MKTKKPCVEEYTFMVTVKIDPDRVPGARLGQAVMKRLVREAMDQYKDLSSGPVAALDPDKEKLERIASEAEFKVQ